MISQRTNEHAYRELMITTVKEPIGSAAKAVLTVNATLNCLYWNTGKMIADNQALFEGRSKYMDQLAKDIKAEFPNVSGFFKKNLFEIRRFYVFHSTFSVQQLVVLKINEAITLSVRQSVEHPSRSVRNLAAQITREHYLLLLNKVKEPEAALFYIQQTQQQALMAQQILKDPYPFDFLAFEPQIQELDIDRQLTRHITRFYWSRKKDLPLLAGNTTRS